MTLCKIESFIKFDDDNQPVLDDDGIPALLPKPATKSVQDLERVIALGKPHQVIGQFAELVALDEQWRFAVDYVEYLKAVKAADSFGVEPPNEPIQPPTKTIQEVLEPYIRAQFKRLRAKLVAAITVVVDDMEFDGDEESQTRMARACQFMSDTDEIDWILADNTAVKVTKATLMQAGRLAGLRQAELWVK
ncbi:hypothetical protein [Pseudoalteromonas sp. R3]|uniref:DUF4376 domain-containing protein n=1 Tax=Pseudoalteromonas sp. R3 TaxID=1709477 RepID=UPI0006B4F516|nr:hypothetical protein [Pseudoalteromonas sp. R3]AZZ98243.1 hypothetical protein ELR70_14640 [Pseudoalteromonas sp. R3]